LKHIVSQEWLFEHGTDEHIIIADCRFVLGDPDAGQARYDEDHIPGAVYFDLEKHLSAPKQEHGGRHPLPDLKTLSKRLGEAGISKDSTVIAYDDQGGAMASRFWWLLKFLGHDNVYVLDGGYTKWKEAGYPVTEEPAAPHAAQFEPHPRPHMSVSAEDVKRRLGQPGTVLIDSREEKRFLGVEETIDKKAGHIPGARHYFWKDVLTSQGNWKTAEELQAHFAGLPRNEEIIVYCGSGVTACPNVLALSEAGFTNVKLYAGSWSDWISYPDNPIATGGRVNS